MEHDTIDLYLLNKLDSETKNKFEESLKTSSILKEEVETRKLAITALEIGYYQKMVEDTSKSALKFIERKRKQRKILYYISAASVAFILGVTAFIIQLSTGNLTNELKEIEFTTRGTNEGNNILDLYKSNKKDEFLTAINNLSSPSDEVLFFAGKANFELGNEKKANEYWLKLEPLSSNYRSEWQVHARYYLGKSYLKSGNSKNALSVFNQINSNKNDPYFQEVSGSFILKLQMLNWRKTTLGF